LLTLPPSIATLCLCLGGCPPDPPSACVVCSPSPPGCPLVPCPPSGWLPRGGARSGGHCEPGLCGAQPAALPHPECAAGARQRLPLQHGRAALPPQVRPRLPPPSTAARGWEGLLLLLAHRRTPQKAASRTLGMPAAEEAGRAECGIGCGRKKRWPWVYLGSWLSL
jgi:hypothetical protein